jgi:hypothetical protein
MAGGGSTPSNTTQTTKTELPAWMEGASTDQYNQAKELAAKPYEAYSGDRIAGRTPDQVAAADAIRNMQGQTGAALGSLGGTVAAQIGGYRPDMVTPRTLAGTDLQPYMNPFTGEVEANSLRALEGTRQNSQNQIGDAFMSSKAFGGSRQALQSAVTDAQFGQQAGDLSAKLREANYNQAVAGATGDITRDLTGQQLNQRAGLDAAGINLAGYKTAGDLYGQAQKSNIADIGLLDTSGGAQQQMDQAGLDLKYQDYLEKAGYDRSQIDWLHQLLASSPGSQTTSINATGMAGGSKGSPAMGALGGALSGAASGAMIGGPAAPYTAAAGAVVGGVLGGLSSR